MKIEKERKAFSRQHKNKDDSSANDKLYKEIELLKDELRKKDSKVWVTSLIFRTLN